MPDVIAPFEIFAAPVLVVVESLGPVLERSKYLGRFTGIR